MNTTLSFNFICGAMLGIEFVSDEDAKSVVIDLVILRLVLTTWAQD